MGICALTQARISTVRGASEVKSEEVPDLLGRTNIFSPMAKHVMRTCDGICLATASISTTPQEVLPNKFVGTSTGRAVAGHMTLPPPCPQQPRSSP
jgi:hypothetical protein